MRLPEWKGLGKIYYDYVLETAPIKRELLAHASTISFLSTLYGNLYSFNSGNISSYCLILCKSGGGKDAYLKAPKKIFTQAGIDYIGQGSYRSDSGVIDTLPEQRVRIDTIDEASSLFIVSNSGQGSSQSNIPNIITELWSNSGIYSGLRTKGDGLYGQCYKPCINIIGAITEAAFKDTFKKVNFESGFLGRFLYFHDDSKGVLNENFVDIKSDYVPDEILETVKEIVAIKGPNNQETPKPASLPITNEAKNRLNEIRKEQFEESYRTDEEDLYLPVLNRSYEYITRMMVWYTASKHYKKTSPIIDLEAVNWSYIFIKKLNINNKNKLFPSLVETPFERSCNKVIRIIKSNGNTITRSKLIRNSRLKSNQLNEITNQLLESNIIHITNENNETIYRILSSQFDPRILN